MMRSENVLIDCSLVSTYLIQIFQQTSNISFLLVFSRSRKKQNEGVNKKDLISQSFLEYSTLVFIFEDRRNNSTIERRHRLHGFKTSSI